tara:strand:- start:5388 stop:5510 length:123 start_codon:yes stop_codon:yes gene_type:complete
MTLAKIGHSDSAAAEVKPKMVVDRKVLKRKKGNLEVLYGI